MFGHPLSPDSKPVGTIPGRFCHSGAAVVNRGLMRALKNAAQIIATVLLLRPES